MVPELVAREHVNKAIAIDRAIFHGTRLIGPALAGFAIGKWGTASAFYLNALSFLALIFAVASLAPRTQGSEEEEARRRSGMKEGIAYVRSDKPTLGMIGLMAAITVFVFPVMVVILPLYARNELHLGADRMGLLMGISSLGSVTGSIGLLAVPRHHRCAIMLAAVIAVVTAMISLSLARDFQMAALSLVLQSLGASTLIGMANTIVQERAPSPLRGRVSAIAGLSFFGLMPFASLGITSVADLIGMRPALMAGAACYLATAMPILLSSRKRVCEEPAERPQ
jgi:MFS family permease